MHKFSFKTGTLRYVSKKDTFAHTKSVHGHCHEYKMLHHRVARGKVHKNKIQKSSKCNTYKMPVTDYNGDDANMQPKAALPFTIRTIRTHFSLFIFCSLEKSINTYELMWCSKMYVYSM